MSSKPLSTRLTALIILLLSLSSFTSAQSAAATTIQGGDNAPISAGPTSAANADAEGGSGSQGGSVNLSMGSIIAIVIVVVVVILLGAASAVLYFLAKRRQWKIRETIRRSAKRVTTILTPRPRTPRTPGSKSFSPLSPRSKGMSFSPRFNTTKFPPPSSSYSSYTTEKPPASRDSGKTPLKIDTSPNSLDRARSTTPSLTTLPPALAAKKQQKQMQPQRVRSRSQERRMDLEKRPRTHGSAFDMDSPVKNTIWTKLFGTK